MKSKIFALTLGLLVALPGIAEEAAKSGASDLLVNALRGLSSMLPKPDAAPTDNGKVSTIGIRGAESTTTLVSPYWKGDRANDPVFAAELAAYTSAQDLLQQKKWDEAQQALAKFVADHPKSDLVPTARYGQALATAGANRNAEAANQLRQFARDYPAHPLKADAEKLATALAAGR